ncbi:MAG: hypothetical protein AAFQ02_10525 [Bacteroidota bacterium]
MSNFKFLSILTFSLFLSLQVSGQAVAALTSSVSTTSETVVATEAEATDFTAVSQLQRHLQDHFVIPSDLMDYRNSFITTVSVRVDQDGQVVQVNTPSSEISVNRALQKAFSSLPKVNPIVLRGQRVPRTIQIPLRIQE